MEYLVYAVLSFLLIYLISYFILVRKKDKYDESRVPVEVSYLIKKYNLDLKKVNYKKFLNSIALLGSVDMTIAVMVIFNIENIILQLVVGFIVLIPLIVVSFWLLAKYYIKKGYVKNERKYTKNRK